MRRGAPVILLAAGLVLLLGSYVLYTRYVVTALRREAGRTGQMFARVFAALNDPREEVATAALLDLSRQIREMGVPVIVTDSDGRPAAHANLPFEAELDDPRVAEYVLVLDRQNIPVAEPSVGTVHFGNSPLVAGLRIIPLLQAATLLVLVLGVAYALHARSTAERERVWAGMARESAHQLATPLSSIRGWVELLEDRGGDARLVETVSHMHADLERLERVAHRFERIGRPARRDRVEVGELAAAVGAYFRARVPTRSNAVTITVTRDQAPLEVQGDPVLLEWAIESLVKNAIDALTGRGGRVEITAGRLGDGRVRLAIADDGPGIPREMRSRIFDAGFSTKERGWGIGLPLARRIVETNHGGTLALAPSDHGAVFEIILG